VPYVLAAIRLDEGPRIISTIVGEAAHEAVIGDAVEVVFLDPSRSGDPRLPCFRLA
jgi:uncharacterized OB-fold protein